MKAQIINTFLRPIPDNEKYKSRNILRIARDYYRVNDINEAIALVKTFFVYNPDFRLELKLNRLRWSGSALKFLNEKKMGHIND